MTSEGPHHPGQEPDEVPPGAGGPAPYGDRPAQPANGYGAGPDLGWAPPPPAGHNPAAPNWAAQNDQPPAHWGAQTPPPADAGQPAPWPATGTPQPAWGGQPEQSGQGWVGAAEQSGQGWTGAAEQPAWAQAQPAARGAAQVPSPASPPQAWPQDDPARSGGWTPQQPGEAAQSEQPGWGAPAQPGPANGGWPGGGPQPQTPGNGWNDGGQQAEQPAWAQAEQNSPAWPPAEPAARGAAQVPTAGDSGPAGWPPATPGQADQPAQPDTSGSWSTGATSQPDQTGQPWRAAPESQPQQPDWMLPQTQERSSDGPATGGWGEAPADPARSGGWSAEPNGTPARASASVPGAGSLPQRTPGERQGASEVEPWAPGEAWGNTDADSANRSAGRPEESPVYQPGPAPGISPANAVPLPPQEQRVPGASLAATPPADYVPPAEHPPAQYGAAAGQPAQFGQPASNERADWPPAEATGPAYESEQPAWGGEAHPDEPSSPAGPVVPAPRTSPESGAAGRTTASAAVPLASRVMPPADQSLRPDATSAPQPRVYGRPTQPEPADEPEQVQPNGYGMDARPEVGPRFDDRDLAPPPVGYAESAPASSGPPPPPAFPPGVPSFVDPPNNTRPVNGNRPHPGERPADPFGSPVPNDPGMPAAAGYGPPSLPDNEPARTSTFPPAFPPAPQQPVPSWPQNGPDQQQSAPAWAQNEPDQRSVPNWGQGAPETDQGRFDAFKPDEEPKTEAPPPKVRNGRVLAAVLTAAVLILAVPLGLLFLLGKVGGEQAPAFDPAVGSCVKQAGEGAVAADCGEANAFTVVSKVDNKDKCGDPSLPHVVLQGDGPNRVLCLKPATAGE
ncbi:hypothetical protein [Micromonospora sp. NPDC005367]|uniref:LppU/SCO3897 family protein n=1 Tax=Micromonospora sp. NPDC005367 TaxID=3155590 RepID=UPI0033A7B028